jgi:hypothetical protein
MTLNKVKITIMPLRKKHPISIFAILLIIALAFPVYSLAQYSDQVGLLNNAINTKDMQLNQKILELNQSRSEIDRLVATRDNLLQQLISDGIIINDTAFTLKETKVMLQDANQTIVGLRTEIAATRAGDSYNLHDPTYAEMKTFLEENTVDQNMYEPGYYVCRHFGKDLRNDATKEGIRCAYVEFYGPRPDNMTSNQSQWRGHVMVGFDTTDKGFIYIEPRYDNEVDIAIGVTYGSIYIEDLLIIW